MEGRIKCINQALYLKVKQVANNKLIKYNLTLLCKLHTQIRAIAR